MGLEGGGGKLVAVHEIGRGALIPGEADFLRLGNLRISIMTMPPFQIIRQISRIEEDCTENKTSIYTLRLTLKVSAI